MKISRELFACILDYYPDWGNSPKQFLEFIQVAFELSRIDGLARQYESLGLTGSQQELAAAFMRAFAIDLSPYATFEELLQSAGRPIDGPSVLARMAKSIGRDGDVYDLLDGSGADLSKETVINDLYKEALILSTINRLQPYIDFV